MSPNPRQLRPKPHILHGVDEPIFDVLPLGVLSNLRHARSESALLWNAIYSLARPKLSLRSLLQLQPLWGTAGLEGEEDALLPYFWGYAVDGQRLKALDDCLQQIDGAGPRTEVDLFLVGEQNIILVEAKHFSTLGRCSRYAQNRCPEIHPSAALSESHCRYWDQEVSLFQRHLAFGAKPEPDDPQPPCFRHYQLARTLLVGVHLAGALDLNFHLWLMVARSRWGSLERDWVDFVDRVRDDALWRKMRVLAWQGLRTISPE